MTMYVRTPSGSTTRHPGATGWTVDDASRLHLTGDSRASYAPGEWASVFTDAPPSSDAPRAHNEKVWVTVPAYVFQRPDSKSGLFPMFFTGPNGTGHFIPLVDGVQVEDEGAHKYTPETWGPSWDSGRLA